jgi:hypothetical protein
VFSTQGGTLGAQPRTFWTGTGDVTLTYTYAPAKTPAPILPAALPLLLTGPSALGLRRRSA